MHPWFKPLTVQLRDKTQRQAETISNHSASKAEQDCVWPSDAPQMEAPAGQRLGTRPRAALSQPRQCKSHRVAFHFLAATFKNQ